MLFSPLYLVVNIEFPAITAESTNLDLSPCPVRLLKEKSIRIKIAVYLLLFIEQHVHSQPKPEVKKNNQ